MKPLPTSWTDVTLAQYYQVISIFKLFKEDWIEIAIRLISLFSEQNKKEIEKINVSDLMKQYNQLAFLSELPENEQLPAIIKIQDKTFKSCLLTSDMTAGQFMDFNNCGKGCDGEELIYHAHELIACMCLTKTTDGWVYEGFDKTSETFEQMSVADAYPFYVFFCKVLSNLQKPILEYSRNQIRTNLKQMTKILQ